MKRMVLFAGFLLPLQSNQGWKILQFNGLAANQVHFSQAGLDIVVDHSSSPVVYPLAQSMQVRGFHAELEIEGELPLTDRWPEDAYLRVGLVAPGKHRLSWLERMTAAAWVKQLFALAPADSGMDRIYFFNLVAGEKFLKQRREVPKSKGLMLEQIVANVPNPHTNFFEFELDLPQAQPTVAIWLASDGDDSQGKFTLHLKSLMLKLAH